VKCVYFGSGVGIGLPTAPYRASMPRRICATGVPAWCCFITSRVMSVQTPQVAAWLVQVTRSGVSAFT
jgi:hypothetical protein